MVQAMGKSRPRALVTGGTSRLGRAICQALHRAGCEVQFTWRTDEDRARALADHLGTAGASHGGLHAVEASRVCLDDPAAVETFARRLSLLEPPLDILVHNAAAYGPMPAAGEDAGHLLEQFRVNAFAPLLLTRRLAPSLARSRLPGGGAVVCLSDIHAGDRPRRGYAAYLMSKAALEQMVRCLALELAPKVRVNAVALGVAAFPDEGEESTPEFQQRYISRVPLGRAGTPREAAEAVRWLALDATYMTGQVIRVDGGRSVG